MEIDARARGKKMMDDCCGMTKRHRKYAHFEIVWRYIKDKWTEGECFGCCFFFFSYGAVFSGVFQITKNLLLIWRYNWLTPEPEPEPEWNVITQMLFGKLKCNEKKREYPHTHTLESGQMVIESGIQMRCSYQIVLCDLLASWGHFEQKHFGSMFSNATPSRSQNTL